MIIDAFGKQCPQPLMMAKKEIDAGLRELSIKVDNETAVKNLTRLGPRESLLVTTEEIEGGFLVTFSEVCHGVGKHKGTEDLCQCLDNAESTEDSSMTQILRPLVLPRTVLFIGKDAIGDGDVELGRSLMNMALYTLTEMAEESYTLVLMNAGVKLVAEAHAQSLEHLRTLEEQGVEILVCGTCLDYYGYDPDLSVGTVSNMYDILETMMGASKVVSF